MLTQAILLFYGTQLFPPGGKLDKLRFVCYGLIILAGLLLSPKFKFKKPKWLDFIALVVLVFAFVSSYYSFDPKTTLLRSTANLLMYFSIFWVLWVSCRNPSVVHKYLRALIFIWVFFYGVNVAFLFFRPQDSFLVYEGELAIFDYKRFNGVTINPNAIGLFSAIIFPVVLWNFRYRKSLLSLFLLIAVVFSFFYSFSRDAFICSVLGSSIYFYLSMRTHRTFIIVYAFFSILLMVIYIELFGLFLPIGLVRADSLMLLGGRVEAWQAALELIRAHPWRGYGFGIEEFLFERFRYVFEVHSGGTVHNSFLGLVLQIGWIPPFILYLALIIFLVKSFLKILRLDSEFQPLISALYASIFSGFLISFFESWIYAAGGILAFPFFIFIMLFMRLLEFEKDMTKSSKSNLLHSIELSA